MTQDPDCVGHPVRLPSWAQWEIGPMRDAQADNASRERSAAATMTINGSLVTLRLDPRTTLLDALREHLKLVGTKKGCDHGQCGSCTVLVAGRRINSCLTLAVMHDGDSVTTIEGVGTPEHLHPLQRAFIERDGFQCGYCTPGQIMSALGLLDEAADGVPSRMTETISVPARLTEAEIRERMSGNICRCAAYPNIIAAIRDCAGDLA